MGPKTKIKVSNLEYARKPLSQDANGAQTNTAFSSNVCVRSYELNFPEFSETLLTTEDWFDQHDAQYEDNQFVNQSSVLFNRNPINWKRAKDIIPQQCFQNIAKIEFNSKAKSTHRDSNKHKSSIKKNLTILEEHDVDCNGLVLPKMVLNFEELTKESTTFAKTQLYQKISPGSTCFEVFLSVFEVIAKLYSTVAGNNNDVPFLWEAIFPKNAASRPCYNPGGKYIVRLWAAGRWRTVRVDDQIPISEDLLPLLPYGTCDVRELWPMILTKALLKFIELEYINLQNFHNKVHKLSMNETASLFAFIFTSLTGWPTSLQSSPCLIDIVSDAPQILSSAFELPDIWMEDEEEVKARMKEEDIRRRQALFLHKKRIPKNIERKLPSKEEMDSINKLRKQKMADVAEVILRPTRKKFSCLCMSGSSILPVLGHIICDDNHSESALIRYDINDTHKMPTSQSDFSSHSKDDHASLCDCTTMFSNENVLKNSVAIHIHITTPYTANMFGYGAIVDTEYNSDYRSSGAVIRLPKSPLPLYLSIPSSGFNEQSLEANNCIDFVITVYADFELPCNDSGDGKSFESSFKPISTPHITLHEISNTAAERCLNENEIFKIKYENNSVLPWKTQTFKISINTSSRVFRVHADAGVGFSVVFSCTVPISLGLPESIWPTCGPLKTVITETGNFKHVNCREWCPIFRYILSLNSDDSSKSVTEFLSIRIILNINDDCINSNMQLILVNNSTGTEELIPRNGSFLLQLSVICEYALVGVLNGNVVPSDISTWHLVVLCDGHYKLKLNKLNKLLGSNISCLSRYGQVSYVPNKDLILFRDVATFSALDPFALRIGCKSVKIVEGQPSIIVAIKLAIIDEESGKILLERSGDGELFVYRDIFRDLSSSIHTKQKKQGKLSKTLLQKRIILEARLDDTRMIIPDFWRDRKPYYWNCNCSNYETTPYPVWELELASSFDVHLCHDDTQLNLIETAIASWEAEDKGRQIRAETLMDFSINQSSAKKSEIGYLRWISQRSTILKIDPALETKRLELRMNLPERNLDFSLYSFSSVQHITEGGWKTRKSKAIEETSAFAETFSEERSLASRLAAESLKDQLEFLSFWREQRRNLLVDSLRARDQEIRKIEVVSK